MKIKIITSCSGLGFSYAQGEIVEVDAERGKDLISGNLAEEIKTTAKSKAGAKSDDET